MTDQRWAEYMPIDDLAAADRNAKDHDQGALDASARAFGFIEPCVIDERTGQLLAGHGRTEYLAAERDAGNPPPEGVKVDDDGAWSWLVVRGVRSRDDAHAEALGLALNRVGELGGWKRDVLAEALDAIHSVDLLDGTGFTPEYLSDLIASIAPPPDLDALAREVGVSHPSDFWPVLRFKVAPDIKDRYVALVAGIPGGDSEQFAWLVEQASRP